jgi:predicted nucleotidyltransferase
VSRDFRDRDYLLTEDDLFFTVIGNVHPNDRVLAYLKYLPSPRGRWRRGARRYRRSMRYYSASNVTETIDFLRRKHPRYVFHSEPYNMELSAVPLDAIAHHFRPDERLRELRDATQLDSLERKAIKLASLMSEASGVSMDRLGVTGSILVDAHSLRFSDIDLVVYGRNESRRVKEALLMLYKRERSEVERLRGERLSTWCKEQSIVHPFTVSEARGLYVRKWNKGLFENTIFSIHPTKVEEEVTDRYGEEFYTPQGIIEAKAKVVDCTDSYFLPAIYAVDNVHSEGATHLDGVAKVVSFEGLYADIAENGEEITVRGKLEHVSDRSGSLKYRRILVGSPEARASDYVKVNKSD